MGDLINNSDLGINEKGRLNRWLIGKIKGVSGVDRINEIYANCVTGEGLKVFVKSLLENLNVRVSTNTIDNQQSIPSAGAVVVVCNLSSGILDGLIALHSVLEVREDVKIIAPQVATIVPEFSDTVICAQNNGEINSDKLRVGREIFQHIRNDGALIVFAASAVKSPKHELQPKDESTWNAHIVKMLQRLDAAVIPMVVMGQNSHTYRYLRRVNKTMAMTRTLLELLRKQNSTQRVIFGKSVTKEFLRSVKGIANLGVLLKANMRLLSLVAYEDVALKTKETYSVSLRKAIVNYTPCVKSERGFSLYLLPTSEVDVVRKVARQQQRLESNGEILLCWDDQLGRVAAFTVIQNGAKIIEEYGFEGLLAYRNFEISRRATKFFEESMGVGEVVAVDGCANSLVAQQLLWEWVLVKFEECKGCQNLISTFGICDTASETTRQLIVNMVLDNFYSTEYKKIMTPRHDIQKLAHRIFSKHTVEVVGSREFLSLMIRNADSSENPLSEGLKRLIRQRGRVIKMGLDYHTAGGVRVVGVGLLTKGE